MEVRSDEEDLDESDDDSAVGESDNKEQQQYEPSCDAFGALFDHDEGAKSKGEEYYRNTKASNDRTSKRALHPP